jgi:lipopolysaccharide transport system ATP-binding protein
LNGAVLGMGRAEIKKKFDDIVAFAGVEQFIDMPVKRYSSGMYVRLAFSIAAHIDPTILIVDEVLAVGDLQFQQRCISRMKEFESAGGTVLFVTHNMEAMTALCSRAIVLDHGRVIFDGSAADGRDTYLQLQSSREHTVEKNSRRDGSGLARACSVAVQPARGQGQVVTGSGITIEVRFRREETLPADAQLELGIGIDTIDGARLFTSRSSWTGVTYGRHGLENTAFCELESLPLVPGTYLVSIALIYLNETLDFIQHCASFELVADEAEVYKHRLDGFGSLQIPCRFR